jgi:hypothetical protein
MKGEKCDKLHMRWLCVYAHCYLAAEMAAHQCQGRWFLRIASRTQAHRSRWRSRLQVALAAKGRRKPTRQDGFLSGCRGDLTQRCSMRSTAIDQKTRTVANHRLMQLHDVVRRRASTGESGASAQSLDAPYLTTKMKKQWEDVRMFCACVRLLIAIVLCGCIGCNHGHSKLHHRQRGFFQCRSALQASRLAGSVFTSKRLTIPYVPSKE